MMTRLSDCIYCGRPLKFPPDKPVVVCPGCQTKNKYPDERVLNRAEFRNAREQQRRDEFCDAEESYLRVLNDFPDDADALWGRLLCHYGAKLIVGAGEKRRYAIRIPRSKPLRAQGDYERAIENALPEMREQYEQDAAYIDRAMEAIRSTAATKPPYDIFLCHKTTPIGGRGYTEDYVRARDLHDLLTAEGYNAFFAPVDMANVSGGEDYEAGIYHALNTAKVMLVVCSDPAHLDATWVKSEWQRFLALRDEGKQVALIPLLYGGMRASALPRAFQVRNLQAIKMELEGKDTLLERIAQLIPREKPGEEKSDVSVEELVAAVQTAMAVQQSASVQSAAPVQPVSAPKEKPAKSRSLRWVFVLLVLLAAIGFAASSSWLRGDDLSLPPAGGGGYTPVVQTEEPAAPTATITASPAPTATSVPTATPVPTLVNGGVKSGDYTIDVYSNGTCHITDYHGSVANLVVPQMLEGYVVTKIREDAFWGCYMEQVTLPDTVTDIGNYAFRSCGSLKSVTLPPNISAISAYTFYSCRSLENVTVPGSARYIDGFAFAYCTSLTDVTIQPGVLEIGREAFIDCTSLTSVTIPDSVTDIHYRAFMHCPNLTLRVPRNSYAAAYAQENNIPYTYID